MIDTSRWKLRPFAHQVAGVEKLLSHTAFAIWDEMGCGKTAQVVNAACELASAGKINAVVVVCPASVRMVWCDETIGEIKKHSWIPSRVSEFALGKFKQVWKDQEDKLLWIVTNYEILRSAKHLKALCDVVKGCNAMLVCDESSYIKSRTAVQTKAIMKLREHCARCVILNGTPIVNNPLDLYSQAQILSPKIIPENYWVFRSKYCEMIPQRFGNGPRFNKIVSYKNLDELQRRIAPYCVRRLKKDCLDLPEKLYTVREIELTPESWKRYQTLKREAVIALGDGDLRLEPNAAVRIMRLAQLTSGILGGTDWIDEDLRRMAGACEDISSEKLSWCVDYLTNECTANAVIVWCRWRRERERLSNELRHAKGDYAVFELFGGQRSTDRTKAIQMFSQSTDYKGRRILIAQPHAGGFGLNLVAATEVIYLSNDFSYGIRLQSEDRCHRPGQEHPVTYIDVLATGPKGQKTIDHVVFKALRDKANLAELTTAMWRKALTEEG